MNRKLPFLCQVVVKSFDSLNIRLARFKPMTPQAWDGDGHAASAVMKYWFCSRISKYSFRLVFSPTINVSKYPMNYKILTICMSSYYVKRTFYVSKQPLISRLSRFTHACLQIFRLGPEKSSIKKRVGSEVQRNKTEKTFSPQGCAIIPEKLSNDCLNSEDCLKSVWRPADDWLNTNGQTVCLFLGLPSVDAC